MRHRERHRSERIGWLRAAVLGANDGIVSTASLVVGVAAAEATAHDVLIAGVAGLVAGALSMAAGEDVSVSSQADTEQADLALEKTELATQPQAEEDELTGIYVRRGLESDLARTVARQLMAKDALGAHARDELGLSEELAARPLQAALASAATFSVGAGIPVLTIVLAPAGTLVLVVSVVSLLCLIALGATAARTGGASASVGAVRVAFWGALAMAAAALAGAIVAVGAASPSGARPSSSGRRRTSRLSGASSSRTSSPRAQHAVRQPYRSMPSCISGSSSTEPTPTPENARWSWRSRAGA